MYSCVCCVCVGRSWSLHNFCAFTHSMNLFVWTFNLLSTTFTKLRYDDKRTEGNAIPREPKTLWMQNSFFLALYCWFGLYIHFYANFFKMRRIKRWRRRVGFRYKVPYFPLSIPFHSIRKEKFPQLFTSSFLFTFPSIKRFGTKSKTHRKNGKFWVVIDFRYLEWNTKKLILNPSLFCSLHSTHTMNSNAFAYDIDTLSSISILIWMQTFYMYFSLFHFKHSISSFAPLFMPFVKEAHGEWTMITRLVKSLSDKHTTLTARIPQKHTHTHTT